MRRLLALFVVALMLVSIASAQNNIGPGLQKKLAGVRGATEKIPVAVLFEGLPSFAEIAQEFRFLGEEKIIREQVIRVMKDKAESLHYWLKQMCQGRAMAGQVSGFTSIWVVNAVALKATPAAIREIAAQPNVEKVILDEPVPMLLDSREVAWGVSKIKAPDVWKYYEGKGVKVAVIDTGANEHGDLKGRVVDGKNYIDATKPPRDDHSHGTHCSGTVAGDGVMGCKTGVAPKATIMAIKVLGANGSGQWSNLWLAIEETIGKEVRVVSMSLGGRASDDVKKRLRLACTNAIAAGVIPVIAAGNSGSSAKTVGSPGDVPEVVTIGATDSNDNIAYFSSRGPVTWDGVDLIKPDVSAPGVNVKSCRHDNDGYRTMSGTSMATPHVAGLVALMVNAKSDITPEQAKKILEQTATDLGTAGKDNTYGAGRVNADKAVNGAQSLGKLGRGDRWETVVKDLVFRVDVDGSGNINHSEAIDNDLMPATVTIWADIKEEAGRKGCYYVDFSLNGPNGNKIGTVRIDYDNIPTDPNKYDAKYGFNVGNFDLVKGTYAGTIVSKEPNAKVKNITLTLTGKATWPARDPN